MRIHKHACQVMSTCIASTFTRSCAVRAEKRWPQALARPRESTAASGLVLAGTREFAAHLSREPLLMRTASAPWILLAMIKLMGKSWGDGLRPPSTQAHSPIAGCTTLPQQFFLCTARSNYCRKPRRFAKPSAYGREERILQRIKTDARGPL